MSSLGLIVHHLPLPGPCPTPDSGVFDPWVLIGQVGKGQGGGAVVHTEHVELSQRTLLASACRERGLDYVHLEERPLALETPVLPDLEAQRVGWHLAQVLEGFGFDLCCFLDAPAHAVAPARLRRSRLGLGTSTLVLLVGESARERRSRLGLLPEKGLADLALDFLESEALHLVDRYRSYRSLHQEELGSLLQPLPPLFPSAPLPRISVCLPYFEQPEFLHLALADLAAQKWPAAEVIVIDDGSRSDEAREAFDQARLRFARQGWLFLRQDNAGPAAARNRAARVAKGEALLFCDADNRFSPDLLACLGRAFVETGAAAVTCAFRARSVGASAGDPGYTFLPVGGCLELGLLQNTIADNTTLLRRSVFLELGGLPTDLIDEDWRFFLELLHRGQRLEVLPRPLFDYRLASGSRSRSQGEGASALGVTEPFLREVQGPWKNVLPYALGALRSPRLRVLEAELRDLRVRTELANAQNQAALRRLRAERLLEREALGREHREAEQRCRDLAGQHRDQMLRNDLLRQQLEASLRTCKTALDSEAGAQHRLKELAAQLQQREDKIARLQASFSWRVTAPLRALRRLILDPLFREPTLVTGSGAGEPRPAESEPGAVATAAPPVPQAGGLGYSRFHYHLEFPRHPRAGLGAVSLRGWCFYEEVPAATGLRAVLDGQIHEGLHGLARPDVALHWPDWPQALPCGFSLPLTLGPEATRLDLELCDGEGHWHRFVDYDLQAPLGEPLKGSYEHWCRLHATPSVETLERLRAHGAKSSGPCFSLLLPVFNPDPRWLDEALTSVRAQTYPHWELCVADDASTRPGVREVLERHAAEEARLRLVFRERNGHICAATNSALELATGDWCVLFDHDDTLAPQALHVFAEALRHAPEAQWLYSDEDKIDELGQRYDPHFKPDWNPDLLRSQNYICHLAALRTSTLRKLGGLRLGFEGAQDWDLFLRASEQIPASAIVHVPEVLYHWRATSGSTALHVSEKGYVSEAAKRALSEHWLRCGAKVDLLPSLGGHWRSRHSLPARPPLVSILIPTRNAASLVRTCLASLFARSSYPSFEVLLIDNGSDEPEALACFEAFEHDFGVRVLREPSPFNYSALNNRAAREARGELLCLLNNDIEITTADWLEELVSQALRPGIGAVGTRLLFPDRRVQHAGVITGLGGVAGHAFKLFHRNDPGHQYRPHLVHNLSAVTAACLVIRKALYLELGGLNEELAVAFNDVDFCLRLRERGYRNLYTPFAEALHHESATRGAEDRPEKVVRFQKEIGTIQRLWGAALLHDPAYNPNFSLDSEDFALAYPPRTDPLT